MAGDAFLERRADIAADNTRIALAVEARTRAVPTLPPGFVLDNEPWRSDPIVTEQMTKTPIQYFAMSLLVLALSVTSYLAIRSIGWVLDGFLSDAGEDKR